MAEPIPWRPPPGSGQSELQRPEVDKIPASSPSGQQSDQELALTYKAWRKAPASEGLKRRRTRNGCLTCRARRVCCDDARPICERCRKGKRVCERPEQLPVLRPHTDSGSNSTTTPSLSSTLLDSSIVGGSGRSQHNKPPTTIPGLPDELAMFFDDIPPLSELAIYFEDGGESVVPKTAHSWLNDANSDEQELNSASTSSDYRTGTHVPVKESTGATRINSP